MEWRAAESRSRDESIGLPAVRIVRSSEEDEGAQELP